ncbi:MAG: hypothetical protein ACKO96_43845, partial [Flammeovirgaceae bacterium]
MQNEQATQVTPDKPFSFGYKCIWLTVTAKNPKEVADFINLKNQHPTNWTQGIDGAYADKIFVSPSVDSLIFVVGLSLPGLDTEDNIKAATKLLNDLSSKFGYADYFVTHRVVELHGWMKSINGQTKRAYSYLGESGENLIVAGEPTEIEKQFDLVDTFSQAAKQTSYFEKEGLIIPNEELVMKIADNWGINPTTLDQRTDVKAGLGIIGVR